MKKLTAAILCACLVLSLAACGKPGDNSSSSPSASEPSSQASSAPKKGYTVKLGEMTEQDIADAIWEKGERKELDLTDAANFPKPDKIIYYTPGKTITFEKDSAEYEKVFSLNQARCQGEIGMYQTIVSDWSKLFKSESSIQYLYLSEYYSLFFNLTYPSEGGIPTFYWIVSPSSPTYHAAVFGPPSEPTELLAYLNSLE